MDEFVIRGRRGWHLFLVLAHLALAVGFGFWAYSYGPVWLWAATGLLALFALLHLVAFVRTLTPIFVADAQGVRLRIGKNWTGILWDQITDIQVKKRSLTRRGQIEIVSNQSESPFLVPIGAATTASAATAQVELSSRYSLTR